MSFSGNRRLRRPAIDPIQTANADFSDRSRTFSRRRTNPLARILPARVDSIDSIVSSFGGAKDEIQSTEKQALRKLRIPETTSDSAGLITPLGTLWTTSRRLHPTPVSAVSPCTRVLPFIIEARSTRGQQTPVERSDILLPSSPETLRVSLSMSLSASCRQSTPSYRTAHRQTLLQHIQQQRLELWEQGARKFGRLEEADVFVKPLQLRRSRREIRSWSVGPDTASSASPSSRRLFVRAVIRSKTHIPIGLKREFDLDALRATIPDPLPSPRSPSFNRETLLSNLEQPGGEESTPANVSSDEDDDDKDGDDDGSDGGDGAVKAEETIASPSISWRRFSPKAVAVPIREHALSFTILTRNQS
ncbi:hypothetical protein V8C37DRAFT_392246 [Trichoderma ceciliae]